MSIALTWDMIVNIIILLGLALTYLIYRNIKRKQKNDPEYQNKLREREQELRRQESANSELDDYLSKTDEYNE